MSAARGVADLCAGPFFEAVRRDEAVPHRDDVVVANDGHRLRVRQRRIRRRRQVQEKRLVGLDGHVALHLHGHGRRRRPRRKRQGPRLRHVIAARDRRAVGGGVGDRDRQPARRRQVHRERRRRRPAVAFGDVDIVDRQEGHRIVIEDRPLTLVVGDDGIDGAAEVDE